MNWAIAEGSDPFPDPEVKLSQENHNALFLTEGIANPGKKGRYMVKHFTYGSGNDHQRLEYSERVLYKTPTVNAKRLLPEWKGK